MLQRFNESESHVHKKKKMSTIVRIRKKKKRKGNGLEYRETIALKRMTQKKEGRKFCAARPREEKRQAVSTFRRAVSLKMTVDDKQ